MNAKSTKKEEMEIKKAERLASESVQFAQKALAKSDQLQAYLSLMELRQGKKNTYKSASDLFKKLKLA